MLAEDLRAKTPDELKKSLVELKKEQFNLRFQHRNGQLENTAQIKTLRKNIARVQTVLRQKELGLEVVKPAAGKTKTKKTTSKKTTAKEPAKKSTAKKEPAKKTTAKKSSGSTAKKSTAKKAKS